MKVHVLQDFVPLTAPAQKAEIKVEAEGKFYNLIEAKTCNQALPLPCPLPFDNKNCLLLKLLPPLDSSIQLLLLLYMYRSNFSSERQIRPS